MPIVPGHPVRRRQYDASSESRTEERAPMKKKPNEIDVVMLALRREALRESQAGLGQD